MDVGTVVRGARGSELAEPRSVLARAPGRQRSGKADQALAPAGVAPARLWERPPAAIPEGPRGGQVLAAAHETAFPRLSPATP
jgi:hypothetical protein